MAIEIREVFQVQAPIQTVWPFVMDPHKVVTCMPGAQLEEVVDERTYVGSVKVKVGAITTAYKGRVQFVKIDEQAHLIEVLADGRETGGGMAKGTMSARLQALPNGQTEMVVEAKVDLTGKIMQVGRGMIQGVAHQIFLQFVARVKAQLETAQPVPALGPAAPGETLATVPPPAAPAEPPPLRILPIILKVIWSGVTDFFRRLFGRSRQP